MPKRQVVKSKCCGSPNQNTKAFIEHLSKPIRKQHVGMFTAAGYKVSDKYIGSGLFCAKKNNFIATGNFGLVKINARFTDGAVDWVILDEFERILTEIEQE